jgi:hypothetical protein
MKRVIMLGTVHELQKDGHFLNFKLKEILSYLIDKFGVGVLMEEWTTTQPPSFASTFAQTRGIPWQNVGTEMRKPYLTYACPPLNHPGHDGTLDPDTSAPSISEYGPLEAQEARELQITLNAKRELETSDSGLLLMGLAHLHSMALKLRSEGFDVIAYSWLERTRP